jgi:hypothetical protein
MTTWTNRPPLVNSPTINSVSAVINTISDTIRGYQTEASWTDRTKPSSTWGVEFGLWVENYLPWESSALPWQRGTPSTNWTNRTPI